MAHWKNIWAKSSETHPGPHSDWFWDIEHAGGGCILDLGCHCVEITQELYWQRYQAG